MADLGWRADGIERARAAGGVELEVYRRPGFTGGKAVRRSTEGGAGAGFAFDNTEYIDDDPDPEPDASRCR
jgi:hypothetical protein